MPGRVFITGGSGFVGSAVIDELARRGYGVNALSNRRQISADGGDVQTIEGDLFNPAALDQGMRGCAAALHLVGIIGEKPSEGITFDRIHFHGTKAVVDAAKRNGLRRYVHMSALGTRADAKSEYHWTKHKAEEYVRSSGLEWTIFRPSMIHGPRGEFTKMEAGWARKTKPPFLFMPYFGAGLFGAGGAGLLQPVFVNDVARAFVDALEKPKTIGEVYPIGGSQRMTWPQMHAIAAEAFAGKRRWVLPIPAWYAAALTHVVPSALLPFNRDQVVMSQEDNTCDLTKFVEDFGWEPSGFAQSLATYAKQVR